ncbi:MAG: transcription termination/antitermination protein NusA [Chloroflexi bacterium RBG_13_52_12]|nr:MAG: transcription termination/antitermination protein NusA [Chloroflexi bacterium RBG_13_52_12]
MKSDFLLAITQLSAEKNLPKDVVLTAVEAALASAYKKDSFSTNQNISVKINPSTGKVEVWVEKTVVEKPTDPKFEITLREAKKLKSDIKLGETIMIESTPENAGRIAAQTAKQVILQRLHEAEHSAIFEEYADKEGEVVSGVVQRFEAGQAFIDMGRTEAVLPTSEQVRSERYRVGQRLKVVLLQVARTSKGPKVIVSRSHPELLRRLFELEVPEVYNGTVEIKSIAREAGFRSKIAVSSKQEGIDPVGCCVGLRGIRIQNIVSELNGEKIDVVMWNPEPANFIANALSPAHIVGVQLNKEEQVATVIVPDKQLSLAIGKEGQNARLAAKLTGWRIDIKSATTAEAEKIKEPKPAAEAEAEGAIEAEKEELVGVAAKAPDEGIIPEEILTDIDSLELTEEPAAEEKVEEVVGEPVAAEILMPPQIKVQQGKAEGKPQLRFAEDIMAPRRTKETEKPDKSKKKKKGGFTRDSGEEGVKARKGRRDYTVVEDEEEYF